MILVDDYKVYNYNDFKYEYIDKNIKKVYKMEQRKKVEYYNIECSYDCETTSTYINNEKFAFVYEWTFGIGNNIIYGRKIEDFITFLNGLKKYLNLSNKLILLVYIHNLNFDFQFFKNLIVIDKCFSNKDDNVIYCRSEGIEFRDSYILSNMSLSKIGEEVGCNKKIGDLDYNIIRHYDTPLNDKELNYCIYDIIVLQKYINKLIKEENDNITKIPLTNTGYVRRLCRNKCFENKNYKKFINRLTINDDEYILLKQCFSGGFTHANALYSDEIMENVYSFDFVSSYPAVMLSEQFPMSKGKKVEINNDSEFWYYISDYCCLFTLYIKDLKSKNKGDNIISLSKCIEISENYKTDNGRLVNADWLILTINEIDFINLCKFYNFNFKVVGDFYIYEKGYLPKPLIESIVELYDKKTKLRGIKEKKDEYRRIKGMINSIFGMMVMDPVLHNGDIKGQLNDYNNNKSRFNYYPWGVWITSYARRNLFSGILELGNDYIYSDTDSLKLLNLKNHIKYFNKYNINIKNKINNCLNYYKIKTNINILGQWDRENDIIQFKTLGAKRYIYQTLDGEYHLTCAGVSKSKGLNYMLKLDKNPLFVFEDGLEIPSEETGKLTHTYFENKKSGYITDLYGNTKYITSYGYVHLEPCSFEVGIDDMYIDYIFGIKNNEFILE